MSLSQLGIQRLEDGGARITIAKDTPRVEALAWIRKVLGDMLPGTPLKTAVNLTDVLLHGDEWVAGRYHYWKNISLNSPPFVKFEFVEPVCPYKAHWDRQSAYFELRDKGAAGDVEAAIAYCKAEQEGKVSHGAMG